MKILVLNYEYPPLGGGAGDITRHISEELTILGHEVVVVTTWFKGLKQFDDNGNLKIFRLKSKRKYIYRSDVFEMRSWIRYSKNFLTKYCLENSFDICFANFALPGGEVALYLKKRFALQYTIISHGHDIPWLFEKEMFWYHVTTFLWIKKICKNSALNFIQTKEMKENIDRFLGPSNEKKNIIIPNGCYTDTFRPDYLKRSVQFKIIFTGRFVSQKDPFTFLNALNLLSKENIQFIANIIGDGIHRDAMEKYVHENSLNDKVNFSGWISKAEILEEYQSSHVFVQSSLYEAMSMSVMEALACGTYAICTDTGLNKELIVQGRNGELFSKSDPIQLAEKLKSYHDQKYKNNFTINETYIERIRTEFNWKNIVLKYEYYLKEATDRF